MKSSRSMFVGSLAQVCECLLGSKSCSRAFSSVRTYRTAKPSMLNRTDRDRGRRASWGERILHLEIKFCQNLIVFDVSFACTVMWGVQIFLALMRSKYQMYRTSVNLEPMGYDRTQTILYLLRANPSIAECCRQYTGTSKTLSCDSTYQCLLPFHIDVSIVP